MELEFRESFLKDLKRIRAAAVKRQVAAVIAEAKSASSLASLSHVKKLQGSTDYYRVRLGDYRIGFKLQGQTLIFLRCLHRKDVYRYFP